MTRLRFVLKDDSIPDKDKVAGIKGVKGVMNQGGQYQVIIGTHVSEVVKDVRREAQISGEGSINKEDMKLIKKDSLWNRFFKTISGRIMPMLGPMIAGGIIKGILVILVTAGILTKTDGTYLVLYAKRRCNPVFHAGNRGIYLWKSIRLQSICNSCHRSKIPVS